MNAKDLAAIGLRITSIRPSSQTDYRYYIIEAHSPDPDTEWERWSERSFDTRAQAVRYIARNY